MLSFHPVFVFFHVVIKRKFHFPKWKKCILLTITFSNSEYLVLSYRRKCNQVNRNEEEVGKGYNRTSKLPRIRRCSIKNKYTGNQSVKILLVLPKLDKKEFGDIDNRVRKLMRIQKMVHVGEDVNRMHVRKKKRKGEKMYQHWGTWRRRHRVDWTIFKQEGNKNNHSGLKER